MSFLLHWKDNPSPLENTKYLINLLFNKSVKFIVKARSRQNEVCIVPRLRADGSGVPYTAGQRKFNLLHQDYRSNLAFYSKRTRIYEWGYEWVELWIQTTIKFPWCGMEQLYIKFCFENDREYMNTMSNKIYNILEKVALVITTGICVVQRNLVSYSGIIYKGY
jgi:hypothetical protein